MPGGVHDVLNFKQMELKSTWNNNISKNLGKTSQNYTLLSTFTVYTLFSVIFSVKSKSIHQSIMALLSILHCSLYTAQKPLCINLRWLNVLGRKCILGCLWHKIPFLQITLYTALFPTWESGASWPAWRSSWRIRRKAVNCVCVSIHMSCRTPIMFTCIKVLRLV